MSKQDVKSVSQIKRVIIRSSGFGLLEQLVFEWPKHVWLRNGLVCHLSKYQTLESSSQMVILNTCFDFGPTLYFVERAS